MNNLVIYHVRLPILCLWFYRQFRLCITALLATRASDKAHTPKVARIQRLPPGGRLFVNSIITQIGRENKFSADILCTQVLR